MNTIKLGNTPMSFVYQGDELLYPNPVKDGLVLWYDFKGMKNSDTTKGVAKDLSGNGNNGTLSNFAYTSDSGYNDGLDLDGIDDRLVPTIKNTDGSESQLDMKKINNAQKFSVEIAFKMSDKLITQGSEIFMTKKTYGRFWVTFLKDNNASSEQFILTTSTYYGAEGERSIYLFGSKEGYKYGDEFHITVTLDKNDKLILYVNGVKKGEQDLSGITITTPQEKDFVVFLGQNSATEYYRRFDHELYSLKVYDKILTDQEVQYNYQLEKERWGI